MEILKSLNQTLGITILMVTHEPDMAKYASRELHFLDGRLLSDSKYDVGEA